MTQVIVKKRKVKEATAGLDRSRRLAKHVPSMKALVMRPLLSDTINVT